MPYSHSAAPCGAGRCCFRHRHHHHHPQHHPHHHHERHADSTTSTAPFVRVEFEVFGTVQKVSFRKHAQEKARTLGLTGWCRNTERGTVEGVIEGPCRMVETMKMWLKHVGSARSWVSNVVFKNEAQVEDTKYDDFEVMWT